MDFLKKNKQYYLIYDYSNKSKLFLRRVILAIIFVIIIFIILITNIYYLQVICFENYKIRSNNNRIKFLPIIPSRGIIFDRNGIPLAINRNIPQLEVELNKIDDLNKTILNLQPLVDLTNEDIRKFENNIKKYSNFYRIPIKIGLTDIQQARFAVNQYKFPGIKIKNHQTRYYPYGSYLSHVIGYVSRINNYDIKNLKEKGIFSNYFGTNNIGKLGIERYYENVLHGRTGYEIIEVNNKGKLIRSIYKKFPESGKDISLTIDINLQKYIKNLLNGSRAAVVVVDPRDGSILALVSNPSYDPNLFVNGISSKNYKSLLRDKNLPLINRVIQGIYPPASTVKPYISISALDLGIINKNSYLFDPGWWKIPGSDRYYRDWKRIGHGNINITKALEESADTFFYQIAYDMGIDRLSDWMNKFGYGKLTGIDLAEEYSGIMPNRKWKISRFNKPWYQGDTIAVGIGQGYWTATPLQMVKSLMILINNGLVFTPHLLLNIQENGYKKYYHQINNIQIGNSNSHYWKIAKDGMYGVANRTNGTACSSFYSAPYKAAAKSGTAQVYSLKSNEIYDATKINERLRDHKLMTAFAPYNNPTVGIVVVLENGGIGKNVGEITRNILDYILLKEDNSFKLNELNKN